MAGGSQQEHQHPYHVRSISLPSGSHPLALQFDEQLQKMKTWSEEMKSAPSAFSSTEMVCNGVQGLTKLYTCVENIMKMPEARKAIARCKNQRWVVEELDGSVRLLDICGSTRDSLALMKEQAQDFQSTIRTRMTGDAIFHSKVKSYVSFNRKASKEINKCLRELKKMDEILVVYPEEDASLAVRALKEVREMTVTVLYRSIFSSLLSGGSSSTRTTYWSLVSKAMGLKQKDSSSLVLALCKDISNKDVDVVEVQKQLKEIEDEVSQVEDGLECLFQGLIRSRVTLLNIINL